MVVVEFVVYFAVVLTNFDYFVVEMKTKVFVAVVVEFGFAVAVVVELDFAALVFDFDSLNAELLVLEILGILVAFSVLMVQKEQALAF